MTHQDTWLRRSKANAEKNRRSPSGQEDRNSRAAGIVCLVRQRRRPAKLSILWKKRLLCIEIYSSRYVKLARYIEEAECTKYQEMNPPTTFIIVQQRNVSKTLARTMQSRRSPKSCNNHKYTRIKSRKKCRHSQNSKVVF